MASFYNNSDSLENDIDFDSLINIIVKGNFKIITLQFSDEYLSICTDIYTILKNKTVALMNQEEAIEFYITADSTFGSAIDDISAMHVNSDLILFFGTDLSSSGTIPTVVVSLKKEIDSKKCSLQICSELKINTTEYVEYSNIIMLSALPYYHALNNISELIVNQITDRNSNHKHSNSDSVSSIMTNVILGVLPNEANISSWLNLRGDKPEDSTSNSNINSSIIGGFTINSSPLNTEQNDFNKNCVVYVGSDNEQFHSILLSVGDKHDVLLIDAVDYSMCMYTSGCAQAALEIRKRYGGILKVKDASVIGLLIGSMGVSQEKIVDCIDRLKLLIKTAHKKSYVFVMGRVTETKLCNFPEVDVYVLISNDDSCYVPPKTYPVPVITPYELEIGLSAREWNSRLETLSDGVETSTSELIDMVNKVSMAFPLEEQSDSESDSDIEINTFNGDETQSSRELVNIRKAEEQALIAFQSSGAVDYFKKRDFQGLEPGINVEDSQLEGNADIMKIHQGKHGVASGYNGDK